MLKPWKLLLATATVLLATACGDTADPNKAQVRLVNASAGYAQLDLRIEDALRQGGVGYGATDSYIEVKPSEADTTLTSAGSPTPLLSFTPQLSKKKHYTVLAYGEAGALRQVTFEEEQGEPESGKALLRVVNAASDAGALDVYLTATGDALTASVPVQSSAAFGTLNGFITVNSATWRLRVTAAGSKTDVRLDLSSVDLPSKGVRTLVITPGGGGLLVKALLVAQQGGIAALDGGQARVRLVAGVTNSATVTATVGTTTLAGSASPSLGDYALVTAGVSQVVVGVNGATLPTDSATLTAGNDYTLLVRGTPASPQAKVVADDNRLPTDTTRAKLRLVNGLASSSGDLSMTLDLFPVASGVALGAGSPYTVVNTTSGTGSGALSVVASGASTPVFTATNQVIAAGGVYSVFVLGDPNGTVTGTLRKDR